MDWRRKARLAGTIYIWVAVAIIFLSYVNIWRYQGFSLMRDIKSLFDPGNLFAMVLFVLPGFILRRVGRDGAGAQPRE